MREFASCKTIIVDGDEFTSGFLGLDWAPSKEASANKAGYENAVIAILERLMRTFTGWAVITEIFLTHKKMTIVPFHATKKDPFNAYAQPTDLAAATLKDTTALDGTGHLPKPGEPRTIGTGTGSDSLLHFSPSTWAPGSGAPIGPGATADEILLHEMVHGMRQMMGRSVREAVGANPGMDNYEEFVAIMLSNIYRSETGVSQLRDDHHGFKQLTGPTANVATFKSTYSHFLNALQIEQPRLCANLRKTVTATYNPLL